VTSDLDVDYAIAWHSTTVLIPEFQSLRLANGNLYLEARVSSNTILVVEATTNLVLAEAWDPIATNTSTSNILQYIDTQITNFPKRFYRLIPNP